MTLARISSTTFISLAVLFATMAAAADFRTLDFGATCDNIESLEAARGATLFEGRLPSGYQFAFRVRETERDAVVGYACKDGRFFRGAYIFDVKDGEEATQVYAAIKRRVTKELGAPSYDFASVEHRRKMREVGAELSRSDTQVAFWSAKKFEAHASVGEPSRDRGWRVSLSYTAMSAVDKR